MTSNSSRCIFAWIIAAVSSRGLRFMMPSKRGIGQASMRLSLNPTHVGWSTGNRSAGACGVISCICVMSTLSVVENTLGHAHGLAHGDRLRISILLMRQLRTNSLSALGCKYITTHSTLHTLYLTRPHACRCGSRSFLGYYAQTWV